MGYLRLVKTGYSTNVLKLDFSSLYPSIQLVHDVFPECDITNVMKGMLKYFRDTRIRYKNLASEYYFKDKKKSESFGRKQLPIKILLILDLLAIFANRISYLCILSKYS